MDERFHSLGMLLKRMERTKAAAADKALAPLGLSMSLWAVLRQIAVSGAPSANVMAEAVFMTPQAFGELVQKLLKLEMIRKKSTVGRAIQYELTDEGQERFERGTRLVGEVLGRLFSPLSDGEIDRLGEYLERIVENMQE